MGWWFFTRSAIDALTRPRPDIGACDRAMEDLARDSRLGGALHRLSRITRRMWAHSLVRAAGMAIARALTPAPAARAWRVRGWIAASAGSTILALDALKPVPIGRLAWLVPTLAVAAGLLTMAMADPLARAAADRRTRRHDGSAAS